MHIQLGGHLLISLPLSTHAHVLQHQTVMMVNLTDGHAYWPDENHLNAKLLDSDYQMTFEYRQAGPELLIGVWPLLW